jgi:curli biogenesis system outer membrane secretion channel CsgG
MKYFHLFGILVTFSLLSCASTKSVTKVNDTGISRNYGLYRATFPKKKIAVTKFINATRFGDRRLGENLTDVLTNELARTNRFVLLERARFDQILEEIKLSKSGLTQSSLNEMQLLGADFIIVGAVTHYSVTTTGSKNLFTESKTQRAQITADIRMINVRTGEIILSETGSGAAEKKLSKVLGMGQSGGYDESLEMDAFRAAVIKLTENIVLTSDKTR